MHSPQELLAAFEHEKLGEHTPRHHGKIEKGSGAPFHKLHPDDQKRHAALEELIDADAAMTKAETAFTAAKAHHAAVAKRAGVVTEEELE